ncbi:SDR family oxidoreductase [Acidobacteria bacterium AH-259-D05]|nr:SDR family oxidoreductase [Acidobacteria bacterium AH-259-D05]
MTERPVALVTGSSRGVGRGIAEQFLSQGYRVIGCSRGPSTLKREGYEHAIVDVGRDEQVQQWISTVARSYGRIDVVINNAGSHLVAFALVTSTDLVESTLRTNFLGTFAVCRESAKVMLKRKFGRIINISSIAVGLHMKGTSAYAASKSAIVEFSKVLAEELGPVGITCNVVALCLLETHMTASLSKEAIEYCEQRLAIKRWATIEDVCNVIFFLASPASSYVTGQVIHLGFVD